MSELSREQIEKWRFWLLERRDSLDVAREANALCDLALRALSDHAEAGQPVAWVYLHKNKLSETFSHQPPDRVFNLDEYTVTPLYAHPPAPRATEQAIGYAVRDGDMWVGIYKYEDSAQIVARKGGTIIPVFAPPSPKGKE